MAALRPTAPVPYRTGHELADALPSLVVPFSAGRREQSELLGGKGANLAEMTRIGLPVPAGFVITTDVCRRFMADGVVPPQLLAQVGQHLRQVELAQGRRLGDVADPLLLSVRSGARFSMPGMMETVLDIGLNDQTVVGLSRRGGDRFAWDCYARLVGMYGRTVLGADAAMLDAATHEVCREHDVAHESRLDASGKRALVAALRRALVTGLGQDVPADPMEQLAAAIEAVLRSWDGDRARLYRSHEGIDDGLGTAVTVQAMVFGNAGDRSGSGVCFTRDPSTGAPGAYGNYLADAQGEDVVNGSRDAQPLSELATTMPDVHRELCAHLAVLEHHYRDLCDVEFTVESGRLWVLQTRVGKRTPGAAFRIARDLVREGVITMDEALVRVSGAQLDTLLNPRFVHAPGSDVLATGHAVSAGAAVGRVALTSPNAVRWAQQGQRVILVRQETSPDDLAGMLAAEAVVTGRGGVTSHAAVVARGMGRPCVVGTGVVIDVEHGVVTGSGGRAVREGDVVSVDGAAGVVFVGAVEVRPSAVAAALDGEGPASADPLTSAVVDLLAHADLRRRLQVHANADTGPDGVRARTYGAQGVGLCRTEHALLGERRKVVEDIVLDHHRAAALLQLEQLHRGDFRDLMLAMDGLPVVVRLLDPPLHEFLPDLVETAVAVEHDTTTGHPNPEHQRMLEALHRWSERNPMLGLRGVRLAVVVPDVCRAQVRALCEATLDLREDGYDPQPRVMVPLVSDVAELVAMRLMIDECLREVAVRRGRRCPDVPVGSMIELPRAALTADKIAVHSDFFSFGTNDLTQTTWGMSRDDAETAFLPEYRRQGLLTADPFATIDVDGVGRLIEIAIREGRATRPGLQLGVCGEQGGDAASVHWFHRHGLDYVSCSPPRVRAARLEAGRAAVLDLVPESDTR